MIGVGYFETTPRMRALVNEVLDSGRISYGDKSRRFERDFAALHRSKHAILSNSGTSALQVALQAMKEIHGWRDGDEVIVPAVTFVATVNIVLHNNMKPVLVDVHPRTYNINAGLIEDAITPRTRAIIPVHLFGQPADMLAVMEIADKHGLMVIEDSCESMFATHRGRPVGSWGDIGCFSTYVAHLITTGVGGICTTSDAEYAAKIRSLVNHGRDGIFFNESSGQELVKRRFRFESIGHSFRITELEAALGLAQLENWEDMIVSRKANANYLTQGLEGVEDLQLPYISKTNSSAWMMYPLVTVNESKWGLCNFLEERGIETREMLPLTNQPCYKGMWDARDYRIAEWINNGGFYVGCHQGLTVENLDRIIDTIKEWYHG